MKLRDGRVGFLHSAQTEMINSSENVITECVTTLYIFMIP